jgi:hypothetical protein
VIALLLLAGVLFQVPRESFTLFTYCREFPSNGIYERQCVQLNPDGAGTSRLKRRDVEETSSPVSLSPSAQEKLLSLLRATRNLADRQKYESKRSVANLGRKHLTLEIGSEKREAEFNYSDLKEVNALSTFLDALLNQQTLVADLEIAAQYERLSVPERLQQLESELRVGRVGDPPGLVPALDKIIQNERILAYAREQAQRLKSQVLTSKF